MSNEVSCEQVAVNVFRWKWISWVGIPTRHTHGPLIREECRVRQLFSPKSLAHPEWVEHWRLQAGRDATGGEPLSYRYGSSQGPERVPSFHSYDDILVLEEVRNYWPHKLVDSFAYELEEVWSTRQASGLPNFGYLKYELGDYSRAALITLDEEE